MNHRSRVWYLALFLVFFVLSCSGESGQEEQTFEEEPWVCEASPGPESQGLQRGYWERLPPLYRGMLEDNALPPVEGLAFFEGYLYAGMQREMGVLRRRIDDAESPWEAVFEPGHHVHTLFVDSTAGRLYGSISGGKVFWTDDGEEWNLEEVEPAMGRQRIRRFALRDGILYATVDSSSRDSEPGAQVVRRLESGQWEVYGDELFRGHPNNIGQFTGLAAGNDGLLYGLMSNGHLYRETATGGWESVEFLVEAERNPDANRPGGRAMIADSEGRLYFNADGIRLFDPLEGRTERLHQTGQIDEMILVEGRIFASGRGGVFEVRDRELITLGYQGLPRICNDKHDRIDAPRARSLAVWPGPEGLVLFAGTGDTELERSSNVYRILRDPRQRGTRTDLQVYTATYLGSSGADQAGGVAISPDQTVILGGRIEEETHNFGLLPTYLDGGRRGFVLRMNRHGNFRSMTRIGDEVYDLAVNPTTGEIGVATDRGALLLSPDAAEVIWAFRPPRGISGGRIAIGSAGTVGYLTGQTLQILDSQGREISSRTFGDRYVEDVEVDDKEGLVFIAGFKNQSLPNGVPVQVAYLRAYSKEMESRWTNWDYHGAQLVTNEADSRGYRIRLGEDGKLYFAGESAGGNSIFRYDPQTEVVDNRVGGTDGKLIGYDPFTQAYQTGANHIGYYSRLEPGTGEILGAQWIIPRLSNNDGNTFRPRGITADKDGHVYVVGRSAAHIANRSANHIHGQRVGTYAGGDTALFLSAPDMRSRRMWTPFNAEGGDSRSEFGGIEIRQGLAVMAITSRGGRLHTAQAHQPLPNPSLSPVNSEIYLAIWPLD